MNFYKGSLQLLLPFNPEYSQYFKAISTIVCSIRRLKNGKNLRDRKNCDFASRRCSFLLFYALMDFNDNNINIIFSNLNYTTNQSWKQKWTHFFKKRRIETNNWKEISYAWLALNRFKALFMFTKLYFIYVVYLFWFWTKYSFVQKCILIFLMKVSIFTHCKWFKIYIWILFLCLPWFVQIRTQESLFQRNVEYLWSVQLLLVRVSSSALNSTT